MADQAEGLPFDKACAILSYGGGVQFGVMSDTALCPDPQAIIDAFTPEFEQLALLTLMLPWGDEENAQCY